MSHSDTIFALSSGSPPAGIAVIRISGSQAGEALAALTRKPLPDPRVASLVRLLDPNDGKPLDQALTLWFPGPNSVTGEHLAEMHVHGGRAVVAAVLDRLSLLDGLRHAEPGEFTRRAFENGRIDLAEAEGLADLLSAETELQRRNAIAQVGGALHRLTGNWAKQLLGLSAQVEAAIDFSDEDDVTETTLDPIQTGVESVVTSISEALSHPPAERLHDGLRVAILGPPNSGKSTLLNTLINRDAAIVSDIPGTTRDAIEASVLLQGIPLIFIDTAGFRQSTVDPIEQLGIERSHIESQTADIILALGGWVDENTKASVIEIAAKADVFDATEPRLQVSATTGRGVSALVREIVKVAKGCLPIPDQVALAARHRAALQKAVCALETVATLDDELIIAEQLRVALSAVGEVTGGTDAEAMLDILFGSFCIGK